MISRPTVLILGAGASVDYGFPTGRDLLVGIWKRTAPGGELFRFLKERMKFFEDDIDNFRLALDRSNSPSVDLFLENRPEFERTGKLAIAASLIMFLGFGFHAINVQRLDLKTSSDRTEKLRRVLLECLPAGQTWVMGKFLVPRPSCHTPRFSSRQTLPGTFFNS